MRAEYCTPIDPGELGDVLGGLFDGTIELVRKSRHDSDPKGQIVSAQATLMGALISESFRRLSAVDGLTNVDAYRLSLRSALVAIAGQAAIEGKVAVPPAVMVELVQAFTCALQSAHTMRRDG